MADRDAERAAKLAKKPTQSSFERDREALDRAKARAKRDASVNSNRTRAEGTFTSKGSAPIDDIVDQATSGRKPNRGKKK